jgi:hypothetical protein
MRLVTHKIGQRRFFYNYRYISQSFEILWRQRVWYRQQTFAERTGTRTAALLATPTSAGPTALTQYRCSNLRPTSSFFPTHSASLLHPNHAAVHVLYSGQTHQAPLSKSIHTLWSSPLQNGVMTQVGTNVSVFTVKVNNTDCERSSRVVKNHHDPNRFLTATKDSNLISQPRLL